MHKPLLRIVLVLLVSALICQLIWLFISHRFQAFYTHRSAKFTELFVNNNRHDVLFIGSSKTHSNINPGIIDSICNIRSYNAGVDGISLFEYRMILEAYLVNHPPPDMVVVSFDLHSFNGRHEFYDPVHYLRFTDNKVIDTTLSNNGYPTFFFKLLPFLNLVRFNDDQKLVDVVKAMLGKTEIPPTDFSLKGYLSNSDSVLRDPSFPVQAQSWTDGGRQLLEDILRICKANSIRPVLIYPPEYQTRILKLTPNGDAILAAVESLATAQQVPLLRHEALTLCDTAAYFRNTGHLNKAGAVVYSTFLASVIDPLKPNSNSGAAER